MDLSSTQSEAIEVESDEETGQEENSFGLATTEEMVSEQTLNKSLPPAAMLTGAMSVHEPLDWNISDEDDSSVISDETPSNHGFCEEDISDEDDVSVSSTEAAINQKSFNDIASKEVGSSDENDSNDEGDNSDASYEPSEAEDDQNKKQLYHAVQTLVSSSLTLAEADRQKLSNANVMRMGAALSSALGLDYRKVQGASLSSIDKRRRENRTKIAKQQMDYIRTLIKKYPDCRLAIHWDGKTMRNNTEGYENKAERLPICLSGLPVVHDLFLSMNKISSGSGHNQADEIIKIMDQYEIRNRVDFLVYDTTASNTGQFNGAAAIVGRKTRKDYVGLPCIAHITELPVGKFIFLLNFSCTLSPCLFSLKFSKKICRQAPLTYFYAKPN